MQRLWQGLRSTQIITIKEKFNAVIEADIYPLEEMMNGCQIFAFSGSNNIKDEIIHVDFTERFPNRSLKGKYHNISIIWLCNKYHPDRAYERLNRYINNQGIFKTSNIFNKKSFKPVLNIMDNVASKTIRSFLEKENITL